jgi:hypothetical protein
MRTAGLALALTAAGLLAASSDGSAGVPGAATTVGNRLIARSAARSALDHMRPSGAVTVDSRTPHLGLGAQQTQAPTYYVHLYDFHRVWRLSGAAGGFIEHLEAHPPPGYALGAYANGEDCGCALWSASFTATHPSAGIYAQGLGFAQTPAKRGSILRVDSWAVGLVLRPSWEYVTPELRSLTVYRFDSSGRPLRTAATTVPRIVDRYAAIINRAAVMQPERGFSSCFFESGPTGPIVQLAFSRGPRTRPAVLVTEYGGCGIRLRFRSHQRSGLDLADPGNNFDVPYLQRRLCAEHLIRPCVKRGSATIRARRQVGYGSCPPGAVKCGPPHYVEIASKWLKLRHPAKLTITASNVVTDRDLTQVADVYFEALLGSRLVCSASASVSAGQPKRVSCRTKTSIVTPGRHELALYEWARGAKIESIVADASDAKVVFRSHAKSTRQS